MPYVIDDKRVIDLIKDTKEGKIDRETFVDCVLALGYLDWEVAEALNKLDGAKGV